MKRAAAIIGPTPSFVRWAIRRECPFRDNQCKNLPYDTFRQLRSMRELSVGYRENRVVDGCCIHPLHNHELQTARGFPVDEVYDLCGERELIQQTCGPCPANAGQTLEWPDAWAGCYGWFFSVADGTNWIEEFESVDTLQHPEFDRAQRTWFAIWQTEVWAPSRLPPLQELLEAILAQHPPTIEPEFIRFCDAVNRCIEHDLELQTELVPGGHSDGVTWTIEPYCSICRCERQSDLEAGKEMACQECGYVGLPTPRRKRKVLGLRPYMLLKDLVGEPQTRQLLDDFHAQES